MKRPSGIKQSQQNTAFVTPSLTQPRGVKSKNHLGIYRRGNVYWLAWTIAGERYRESLRTDDEGTAIARALEWRASPPVLLGAQLRREIDNYIAARLAEKKFRPVTGYTYKRVLLVFAKATGAKTVGEITPELLERWHRQRKNELARCTADLQLKIVRGFCRWLAVTNRVRFDPARSVKAPVCIVPAKFDFCEAETVDRLIGSATTDELRFILLAGFDAGMRRNEIVEARWSWFTFSGSGGSIRIAETPTFRPKNNRPRVVPLTTRFREFLLGSRGAAKPDAFVLRPTIAQRVDYRARISIGATFKAHCTALGEPAISLHTMRRTFASLRVSAGTSIYKVASWLGDSLEIAMRHYAHLAPVDSEIERVHRVDSPREPLPPDP